ncbi:MAG TPA: POTRA domain-containing protein [Bryobacteraceae bacterium]
MAGVAQSPSERQAPKTAKREAPPGALHTISIKGNQLYSPAAIVKESGLHIGERVDAQIIEQARKKLQDTELFSSVADEYRFTGTLPPGYDLTFEVAEIQQLFPMRFERLGVEPDAIRQYLQSHVYMYSDRIPGTEGVLSRYKEAVRQFVAQTHPDAKVKAAISNDDPQQLTVLFTPDTPAPTISQVTVTGNQVIDTGTILRAVNQVAIGVPLSDTRLKLILDGTIKPLYAAKGYAAVTFPKVETEPSQNNLGVVVKVDIKEGPLFTFGSIRFHGNGMDQEEIRANIPFKPGQPFNSDQIDKFRLDLQHRMRRHGLLDASVTTQMEADDAKRAVNVTYNVVPGEVYNFQKLDIQGLDITTQPAIAKLWGEKPGHPFNPDYPEFFLKRVREQGIFDNLGDTQSDYTADASSHNVTVHLYFKGGKSQAQREKDKEHEKEKRTVDGTWSPWPY